MKLWSCNIFIMIMIGKFFFKLTNFYVIICFLMMMMMMMMIMMMNNCFCGMVADERRLALFAAGTEILTIANLWHAASRVWTCAEPEFRLIWMKFRSSDNHNTTTITTTTFSPFLCFVLNLLWIDRGWMKIINMSQSGRRNFLTFALFAVCKDP